MDSESDIQDRCHLIEVVSANINSIPDTSFIHFDDHIIYKQAFVEKKSTCVPIESKVRLLSDFSKDLDKLCYYSFVHGDINYSNVIYDGCSLKLVDLEPSFRQNKNGQKVLVSGLSFRSINDYRNKTISSETDKIGFYFICDYYLNQDSDHSYNRNQFRKRINGKAPLKLPEKVLIEKSFEEIFNSLCVLSC